MPRISEHACTRRDWLRLGGLAPFGLSLPGLLRAAEASRQAPAARSCVLFLLHGGPSQLDTWDLKPAAPDNVRGEFKPIATSVTGTRICEHLPRLAQRAHLYTIVRSMTHTAINHNTATYTVTTGHPPLRDLIAFTPTENDFPHLGAQVAFGRKASRNVPTAVSLPDSVTDGPYTTPGQNGGFLGARYAPFRVLGDPNEPDFRVDGLADEPERLAGREALRQQLDRGLGRLASAGTQEMDRYRQRAVSLLTSDETRRAFDLGREHDRVRERYGRHKYGQSLLLARRLVEAGVRLVTVYWGGKVNNPSPHGDTHFNNNRRLKDELLPPFDQCFSAFLDDLQARGLLETTLVLAMGEFGRTPRFGQFTGNGVNETGRDHWAACYSILVAGGKASGGGVLGKSDRFAAYPADDPCPPEDVQASVLLALGVSPASPVRDAFGRDVALSTGKARKALFGIGVDWFRGLGMLLRSYVRWRDERLAREDEPHKRTQPLAYGLELLGEAPAEGPLSALAHYARRHLANSDAFFLPPRASDYALTEDRLTFSSPIETEEVLNRRVCCRVFEAPRRERAVVLLPHWNATAAGYDRLGRCLRLAGITAVRMSLPYHDDRRPPSMKIAEGMVSANLGLTIRSCRQAVLDARLVIDWLAERGHTRIGVVGSSLGSSIASLVAAHDPRVSAAGLLLTAGQFGEVVWTGRATRHIRQAFEGLVTLEQLNEAWSIISPLSYVHQLRAGMPAVLVLSGREDTVFEPYLTERLILAYRAEGVRHRWRTLPCGHYTMATFPFALWALSSLVRFLRAHL